MHGFGIILIPAGILAAIVCFRWARTLAMLAFVCAMAWFLVACSPPGYHYEPWSFTQTRDVPQVPDFHDPAFVPRTPEDAAWYRDWMARNAAENAALRQQRLDEIDECVRRVDGVQAYSGQIFELCASGGRGPWWAYGKKP